MRRGMLVVALIGLVLLLRVPVPANGVSAFKEAAAPAATRVVVFELFASPT